MLVDAIKRHKTFLHCTQKPFDCTQKPEKLR